MWRRILSSLLVVIVTALASPLSLGSSFPESDSPPLWQWTLTGPFGGDARRLAAHPRLPNRVFVGTNDGQLFRSEDGGRRWVLVTGFNRPGFCVSEILIDIENPDTLYVAGWLLFHENGGGIYRSRDGGVTWELVLHSQSVRALAQSPTRPDVLVAGTLDGVLMSRDRGSTWQRISPEGHPEIRNIESLAVDPRSEQIIYVGTWHLPWKTVDGGRTWFRTGGRDTGIVDDSDVFSIVIDGSNPDVVYLTACTGIYKSVTAGRRWSRVSGVPSRSRRTLTLAQDEGDRRVVYAGTTEGLWRTTDGGATWSLITSDRLIVQDIALIRDPGDAGATVLIATENAGILALRPGRDRFETSNEGFSNRTVSVVVADREIRGRIYCGLLRRGLSSPLFLSEDGGYTWSEVTSARELLEILSLFQSRKRGDVYYALTPRGIFRSENRGLTWSRMPSVESEAVKGKEAESIVEVAETSKGDLLALTRRALYLFDQTNQSWRRITVAWSGVRFTSLHASETDALFVGTDSAILLESRDRGQLWKRLHIPPAAGAIQAIFAHPSDEGLLFIGTPVGLFRSHTGGKHWERCSDGLPVADIVSIRVRPDQPDEMVVCDYRRGAIYYSRDRGRTWERIDAVTAKSRAWMASFDPFDTDRVLVASSGAGVYVGIRQARREAISSSLAFVRLRLLTSPQ